MNIEIVTPAAPGSLHGNRITALRWGKFIEQQGHSVAISESWSGKNRDMLIALHAYRSHDSIQRFKNAHPDKPIILIMTGTDLYRDMANCPEVLESMELANRIVLLQPSAMQSIPKKLQAKTLVIYQSVKAIKRKSLLKRDFLISVIGHLRAEKDPFCTARSLQDITPSSKIKVIHLGKSMNPEMKALAKGYSTQLARYHWLGEKSHAETLQYLSKSHVMVISSLMEGGAHVVSEAIAIGVPVIASDIPGNRGLLGDDYLGYFPVGNAKALAAVLQKAETEPRFYRSLEKQIQLRQNYVRPDFEFSSIQSLIKQVLP
ncbi:selenoneine biosynthesis selenosugar synthase SenB [Polynucleobacter antarcticus]|uniref:TIGR04348 family glycosyltransferase n=1 Tax=Polynucleobacter antarcticus TaxID=1743162 RepID=A0A6M9PUQ2_9BURK|nr:selenoneine biosynthesis selenosugar synthase SenB [Polynucleobacter antarcticus]QKM63168.1 TIGR04348 family glycosyltransferase [Polynucleobacter antarcticus]